MPRLTLVFVSMLASLATAQTSSFMKEATVYSNPAVVLTNDKLELSVAIKGGSMVRLLLRGDEQQLSPYGNPERYPTPASAKPLEVLGHFICVDGFGPASAEERAAGLPMHGEAHLLPWQIVSSGKQGGIATVKFSVELPLLQKALTRTIQMVDDENVIYVESELESRLAFDHPVNWGEHLTVGVPFLEPDNLVVDISGSRSRTRDVAANAPGRRLLRDTEFTWPMAPLGAGGTVDLRPVPAKPNSADHTTTLLDPSRKLAFVTALNTARQYLVGMVFRREEFPFIQTYEGYRSSPWMIRALEPATQPFDLPRRVSVQMNSMFETLTYRWLPAKSKISSRFLEFYVKTPAGMTKIDDVKFEGGKIVIEDRTAGKQITLKASLPL